jgi:osmotically-inducible protein OsmY
MIRIIIILVSCLLTACAYNAAVSGAQVVYNRHSIRKNLDDNLTTMQANHAIDTYGNIFKNTHLTIATFNDSVLLAGQVRNREQKEEIEKIIQPVVGDRTIYNFLEIANPSSSLVRTSDSWITGKIKSQLIAIDEADPAQIKVVTENGTVYLMGVVQPRQAEIAVDVAKETSGVQRVVKIFSYLIVTKQYKM